jgi:hypothetical protein
VDAPVRDTGGGQRYLGTFVVNEGPHTVKFAAVDVDGRTGSVEHRFTAKLNDAGRLRLGDLVLNDPLPGSDDALRPAVTRTVTGSLLVAYLEAKGGSGGSAGATARLEIAADPNAAPLLSGDLAVEVSSSDRAVAQGAIDLASLPPGDYVARAIVAVDGKAVARVVREFTLAPSSATRSHAGTAGTGGSLTRAFDPKGVLARDVLDHYLRPYEPLQVASRPGVAPALDAARQGRPEGLADAIPAGDADAMALLLRGVGLLARGELEPAAATFRAALRADSELAAATFYLGACYAAGGRDREAIGAWQTALAGDEDARFVYIMASDAYLRLKDPVDALDLAREAYDRWRDDPAVRMQFVRSAAAGGQPGDALQALDSHVESSPRDAGALLLGMKIIYDVVSLGKTVDGEQKDEERFVRYLSQYQAAGGPDLALAERWRRALWSKD